MTKPAHHCSDSKVPNYRDGVQATLNTPNGVYVVRMTPAPNNGIYSPYYWSILTQPAEQSSTVTAHRPHYDEEVRLSSELTYPSYNEYHRAINYLEDRLYAEQQQQRA